MSSNGPGIFGESLDDGSPHAAATAENVAEAFIGVLFALGAARRREVCGDEKESPNITGLRYHTPPSLCALARLAHPCDRVLHKCITANDG
jgi:hypothetical protein